MKQICKLCRQPKVLEESHIVPKFVLKWMKSTGGKYLRTMLTPNVRQQDGFKKKLLCRDCEQKFSTPEKWFSEYIFIPYLSTNNRVFHYNEKLGKFCISLLWRVLLQNDENNEGYNELLTEAYEDWRGFLDDEGHNLRFGDIHLVLIPEDWGLEAQPNEYIYRYFGRICDGGVIKLDDCCIVFSKIARFFIFGELYKKDINFRGTEVSLKGGITVPGQAIVNNAISEYFINRGSQVYEYLKKNISEKQQNKIDQEILNNIDELLSRNLGRNLKKDISRKTGHFNFKYVFTYVCDCCTRTLQEPEGYLLRTFEVIKSHKYWAQLFEKQNLGISGNDLNVRVELFKHTCSNSFPWVICSDCIALFDIDLEESLALMAKWIAAKGEYQPPKSDDFRAYLSKEEIQLLSYAIVTI